MALDSTVHKIRLQVSDLDRQVYGTHSLTVARHPSETEERMMVRVLAFARHSDDALVFGRGLSSEEEAPLSRSDLTGRLELWIAVGLPDVKELRKACGRADEVVLYAYGGRRVELWWKQNEVEARRLRNLTVFELPQEGTQALAALAQRTMQVECTIQEGRAWFSQGDTTVEIEPVPLQVPGA
jgi:uncharacterized protein YaeQ